MKLLSRYIPIIDWLPTYTFKSFKGDFLAGITVGVMLIPQGMAYALIAGLPVVYGLYAAIVPQVVYAFLGTSRRLSVGPVAMDSLLVAGGIAMMAEQGTQAYIDLAILTAFFVGLFQFLLGVFRMGFVTNLLSKPVVSGFTSAAAVIIALSQLKHLLGIDLDRTNNILELLKNASLRINEIHMLTLFFGLIGILLIATLKKINGRLPGALLSVLLGTIVVVMGGFDEMGLRIIRDIPSGFPGFNIPNISLTSFNNLAPLATTIALIGFMESFSVAKAQEAKRKDHRVKPSQELIGLGAANFVGSFFLSYPVTGGFSRSAVNDDSGAKTPIASLISACLVGLILLFLTPLFYYLPHAILASIIMVAVSGLIDFKYPMKLWHDSKIEFSLLIATFLLTLFFGMVKGISTGVAFSILYLLYKGAYPHIAILGRLKGYSEFRNVNRFKNLETWDKVLIVRIDAALTFINIQGVLEFVESKLDAGSIEKVIVDAGPVSHIDATAAYELKEFVLRLGRQNVEFILCDIIGPVRDIFHKIGLVDSIGKEHFFLGLNEAVSYAIGEESVEDFNQQALQTNIEAGQ